MKKFVIKLFAFSFILVLYFGLNALLNYNIFKHSKSPINDAKVIISGDSHPRKALNPNRFDSAENISQGSEPYVITYWKLKYIFQHHKPETLLLGFAHHNITAFNDMKFWNKYWSSEMFKRSYIIGSFGSLDKIKIDYSDYHRTFFRQMCLYPHTEHFNFIGRYKNDNENDLSDIEKAILRHYYYQNEELGISETSILYLDYILSLCKKHDVTPILVGSPVHKEYFNLIPNSILNRYNREKERLKKQNIVVLDFTSLFYEDSYYRNADHLNDKGASRFTDEIIKVLNIPM